MLQDCSRNKVEGIQGLVEAEGMTGGQQQVEQQLAGGDRVAYLTGTQSKSSSSRTSPLEGKQVNKLTSKQPSINRNKEGEAEGLAGLQNSSSEIKTSLKEEQEVNKLAKKLANYLTGTQSSSSSSMTSPQGRGRWPG